MIAQLLPEPYRERYIKWWRKKVDAYDEPPDSEPRPTRIEHWEGNPTGFGFAIMYCQECYDGELCEYHQTAKDRFREYRVSE